MGLTKESAECKTGLSAAQNPNKIGNVRMSHCGNTIILFSFASSIEVTIKSQTLTTIKHTLLYKQYLMSPLTHNFNVCQSCQILSQTETWQSFGKYSHIKFHENPSGGSRTVPCGRMNIMKLSLFAISQTCLKINTDKVPPKKKKTVSRFPCPLSNCKHAVGSSSTHN